MTLDNRPRILLVECVEYWRYMLIEISQLGNPHKYNTFCICKLRDVRVTINKNNDTLNQIHLKGFKILKKLSISVWFQLYTLIHPYTLHLIRKLAWKNLFLEKKKQTFRNKPKLIKNKYYKIREKNRLLLSLFTAFLSCLQFYFNKKARNNFFKK